MKRLGHFVFLAWWIIGAGFLELGTRFLAISPCSCVCFAGLL
jgi:hypothetical protein